MTEPAIQLLIPPRERDLGGGMMVRRLLPFVKHRRVGPFVFVDHAGPVTLPPGQGDVRPHPHIGLATLTWMIEGTQVHRDSLGSVQVIQPGDANWMVAGRGIVHSERANPAEVPRGPVHLLQLWVALPEDHAEAEPAFSHHPAATIPALRQPGVHARVVAGEAWGLRSPVPTRSPTLFVHLDLEAGATLTLPDGADERALYVLDGDVACGGEPIPAAHMAVLSDRTGLTLTAHSGATVILLGGGTLPGELLLWWNFVARDEARLAQARADWAEGRFPKVPGDEVEFTPLPPV